MAYYTLKIVVTTVLVVVVSEVAKRSTLTGAILASIPIVSVLAMIWLYIDTNDVEKISTLSTSIFWLVVPSLSLFISLPILLKQGINFYISISLSVFITILCYWLMISLLQHLGIRL